MDNNGQLIFSDDPLLQGSNEAFSMIEEGNFRKASDLLNRLLTQEPSYPGLAAGYRTARFWENRQGELEKKQDGKEKADFLMKQWVVFEKYAAEKEIEKARAYEAVMKYVFFHAAEHYRHAFQNLEDAGGDFDLLLNLGDCFLRLQEYRKTIDTLEYARNSYKSSARLLAILAEAWYHQDDIPRSLLYFKEAFFIEPSEIDLNLLSAKPIHEILALMEADGREFHDRREWIPIYGYVHDIFFVRAKLNRHQVEHIGNEIYNLELNFQKLNKEQRASTNVLPRLINKYLWMMDYYEFQNFNMNNLQEMRQRLISIDHDLFHPFFEKKGGTLK